jgi:hypothetical protein
MNWLIGLRKWSIIVELIACATLLLYHGALSENGWLAALAVVAAYIGVDSYNKKQERKGG